MKPATLEPVEGETFRIAYAPEGRGHTFAQAVRRAAQLQAAGDIEGACNARFHAFQHLAELIPEDEEVMLGWEDEASRSALELVSLTATDHFLAGDWEMCAAMLEMLLDLDPEDHLGVTKQLAYCYVVLGEWELFDEAIGDVGDKDPERTILSLWNAFRQTGAVDATALETFRRTSPELWAEFTAEDHPADAAYLADLESERPSRRALAREIWLQTEHLWAAFPGFTEGLRG